jgi:hypothetical protein
MALIHRRIGITVYRSGVPEPIDLYSYTLRALS